MEGGRPREELAKRIAGEIVISDEPGATIRKWRRDFDVAQTELADELDVSSSVISDYEGGRRGNPGTAMVERIVDGLLKVDERRGGERIRQHARILSSGFQPAVVRDLREYPVAVPIDRLLEAVEARLIVAGKRDRVTGHTVLNSVAAITTLSSEEFYHLYGQSTSRAMVFTEISRGESPLVALRVVTPTPNVVVLHGIDEGDVWEHAATLARIDGYALAVTTADIEAVLSGLADLP